MHIIIAVAIITRSILLSPGANAFARVEANNLLADATFKRPNLAAPERLHRELAAQDKNLRQTMNLTRCLLRL